MKASGILISLIAVLSVNSCTKDKANEASPKPEECPGICGTVFILPEWTQTLSTDELVGNWIITRISYFNNNNTSIVFDSIYYPNVTVSLNSNSAGILNSQPITWDYFPNADNFPKLSFVNINSLYPFPNGFILNDTINSYIESYQDSAFVVKAEIGSGGQWESTWIEFKKQ